MSKTKYDFNRYKRIYPLTRTKPNYKTFELVDGLDIETAILEYTNEYQKSYSFIKQYTEIPVVAATPEDENVNIFITSLTTNSVTVESSSSFVGKVHIQIYEAE